MNREATSILEKQILGVLGTVCEDGSPYTTTLHIVGDDTHLYWFSQETSTHSENILRDPRVSISMFLQDRSEGLQGLYVRGKAELLSGENDAYARELVTKKFGETPKMVEISAAYRLPIGVTDEEKTSGKRWYFYS
jgi:nitroimidazol reductase NimA-like FMN-containing flavoprotein (pyridoxamine 5'-phosphate oxidase superfamily)